MRNEIPDSWTYTSDLENLLFFFQNSEELLSYSSPDSFRLPVCNSMTLCYELRGIYGFLYRNKQIERYYSKYIPCIIDELIKTMQDDQILKKALGLRLANTISGLTVAKERPQELLKWVDIISHSCTLEQHLESCKSGIINNVKAGNNKNQLIWLIQNYYIDLVTLGYSQEYLYQSVIRFFDKRGISITSAACISSFLDKFDSSYETYEFYVIADTYKLDNLSRINPQFGKSFDIKEIEETEIIALKKTDGRIRRFYSTFEELKKRGDANIKMLSCKSEDVDPYSAFESISRTFDLAQCFEGYFKHKAEKRIFFDILLVSNSKYIPIKLRRIIPNRPYIDQAVIDKRIDTMMRSDSCPIDVVISIIKAMDMHLDALNCKNAQTMLRTFWTALEALVFTSDEAEQKESTKFALLHIIQKTYILKQFRLIYEQLTVAITDSDFWKEMGVENFAQFVSSFMSSQADDEGFKKYTAQLSTNPLLRTRIYRFRKELSTAKNILKKTENHKEKVSWQIDRIYRTRNLSTHAGVSMPYVNEILFNVHNYFDYVVNYIVCKLENGHYIQNISALVFEAKTDNQIHYEFVKKAGEITEDNYLHALFGPDVNIIEYNFEVVVYDDGVEKEEA